MSDHQAAPDSVPFTLTSDEGTTRSAARQKGRAALGVTGTGTTISLREVVRRGRGWYPITALGALTVVDAFQVAVYGVMGPEIADTFGVNAAVIAGLGALRLLAVFGSALPAAALTQRKPRRALLSIMAAALWTVTAFALGVSKTVPLLALWYVIGGIGNGTSQSLHRPLVIDSYPPSGRVRVLALYRSFDQLGAIGAPLLVAALTTFGNFTWRGVFIMVGLLTLPAFLYALRLRDPGFGTYDEAALRATVRGATAESADLDEANVALGFFEIVRRLFLIPTVSRILVGWAVLGMSFVPLSTYLSFFLADRWKMGPGARALFQATLPAFSLVSILATSRRGESMMSKDPGALLRRAAWGIGAGGVAISLVPYVPGNTWKSPWIVLMLLVFGSGFALQGLGFPSLEASQLSIIPASMRPHAAALAGIFLSAVGGIGGVLLLGSLDRRFGSGAVFAPIGVLSIVAGLVLRSATKTINADLDRNVDALVETEELRGMHARGERLPMLACRGIDFSYGTVPVLFDVDFTVDDGEIVALLGTNGAGKSTLLRVVSGLGLPQSGTVRFRGQDITYVDAERRVAMGITQIPGGKAAFGPLSVVENLRVAGYTHGRNRQLVDAGIEESFAAFPRLAERRNQLAGTLSGGEQQMLALSKALILKPRLLVIDELSLGLAPIVVGELLIMVRRINESGTAVVLVEQSVNVALSLVRHAYFMEKGEIRFDGPANDLLGRTDLLRSVFLEGSAAAVTNSAPSGPRP